MHAASRRDHATPTDVNGRVRDRAMRGFTLVEILIVVVILGILAAIVVPQFSNASMEATRSATEHQLQQISNQIELYRSQNGQAFPTQDPEAPMGQEGPNGNWGVLVSAKYFRDPPRNPYNGSITLVAGNAETAIAQTAQSATGWYFEQLTSRLDVFAAGYDAEAGLFHHELTGNNP
jgi:general secretion pathway protein G